MKPVLWPDFSIGKWKITKCSIQSATFSQICELEESGDSTEDATFPVEYGEYREEVARVDDTPAHRFERDKVIKYEVSNVKKVNLGMMPI